MRASGCSPTAESRPGSAGSTMGIEPTHDAKVLRQHSADVERRRAGPAPAPSRPGAAASCAASRELATARQLSQRRSPCTSAPSAHASRSSSSRWHRARSPARGRPASCAPALRSSSSSRRRLWERRAPTCGRRPAVARRAVRRKRDAAPRAPGRGSAPGPRESARPRGARSNRARRPGVLRTSRAASGSWWTTAGTRPASSAVPREPGAHAASCASVPARFSGRACLTTYVGPRASWQGTRGSAATHRRPSGPPRRRARLDKPERQEIVGDV